MKEKLTPDDFDARLKFWIGIMLGLTLVGIVFSVLYSLIFVTQPLANMAPADAEFFKLIGPIANFIVGALSGVMATAVGSAIRNTNKPKDPQPEEDKNAG